MDWLTNAGSKIKGIIVNFLDADDDGKVTLSDLPSLIRKGQQLVAMSEALGQMFGSSGKTKAKAADAVIEEAFEESRGNDEIVDTAKWHLSKEQFRESMYNRAAALKKPTDPADESGS